MCDEPKKWDIKTEEIPVLVSMGKNGVGVLEEIFDELQKFSDDRLRLPIKYIFVCGKNVDLQMRLEQKNLNHKNSGFKICGLLSAQEMNELMNVCPLYVTKPGGAASSEALETGTHLLMMCSHPWEEANGAKIERLGIGQRLQEDKPLALQIEDYAKRVLPLKRAEHQSIPWKKLLMNHIESMRGDRFSSDYGT